MTLWEQTDNASVNNSVPSQYFLGVVHGGYAADDFVVPSQQIWQIDEIYVPGIYTAGDGQPQILM